jgi:hypothetical protein
LKTDIRMTKNAEQTGSYELTRHKQTTRTKEFKFLNSFLK